MKAELQQLNKEQSAKLGISEKAVAYIRSRLLGEFYKGDIKKLLESVVNHKQRASVTIEQYKKAIINRELLITKNKKQAEIHKSKIENTKQVLESTENRQLFYQELIDFLNSGKAEELNE